MTHSRACSVQGNLITSIDGLLFSLYNSPYDQHPAWPSSTTCQVLSFILFNIPDHAVVRCRDSSPSNSEERDALNVSGATYITCRPIHTYHTCTRSVDIHDWEWRLASLRGIASILLPSLIFTCAAEPGSVRHRLHRRLHQHGAYFRFQIPMPLQSSTRYAL